MNRNTQGISTTNSDRHKESQKGSDFHTVTSTSSRRKKPVMKNGVVRNLELPMKDYRVEDPMDPDTEAAIKQKAREVDEKERRREEIRKAKEEKRYKKEAKELDASIDPYFK